jgi:hypothetical protein
MTIRRVQTRSATAQPSGGLASVVAGGYCVGCGACKVASGGSIAMARDQYGAMQAQLTASTPTALVQGATVCPFTDAAQMAACDFCDDIFGETADAAFGDAWLPEYVTDWRGTNVVVVRHTLIQSLLTAGRDSGELALDDLSVESAVRSQEANYRHRWDGLSVRLQDAKQAHMWTPRKRLTAGSLPVDPLQRRIVRLRQRMATRSHQLFLEAKHVGDLRVYTRTMAHYALLMELYYRMHGVHSPARFAAAVRERLARWLTSAASTGSSRGRRLETTTSHLAATPGSACPRGRER